MVKTVTARRQIQVGRLVVLTDAKNEGKLATVVNVIDQNRLIIDGAGLAEGSVRGVANLKDVELTDFVTPGIGFGARTAVVKKAVESSKVEESFAATTWAQKLKIRKAKANLDDFGRFQLARAKRARNALVRTAYFKLLKESNKGKSKKSVKLTAAAKKTVADKRAKKTAARIAIHKKSAPTA